MRPETAQVIPESLLVAPAGVVTAISVMGITLQDWVYIFTIIWTVLGITHHVWTKWIRPWRERRAFESKLELPPE